MSQGLRHLTIGLEKLRGLQNQTPAPTPDAGWFDRQREAATKANTNAVFRLRDEASGCLLTVARFLHDLGEHGIGVEPGLFDLRREIGACALF